MIKELNEINEGIFIGAALIKPMKNSLLNS